MTDEQRRIRSESDELLEGLREIRRLEELKRTKPMSTPPFHELAEEVERQARDVFRIAQQENRDGSEVETTDVSTNDTPPEEER